jgi:hypothetical protein
MPVPIPLPGTMTTVVAVLKDRGRVLLLNWSVRIVLSRFKPGFSGADIEGRTGLYDTVYDREISVPSAVR